MLVTTAHASGLAVAGMIAAIVAFATIGDLLIASAMRRLDLDAIRAQHGIPGAAWAVVTNLRFLGGVIGMACGFFSLLYALSHADVSLIGPASASLTFVTNAAAARFFLNENVDRRRWAAALCICLGVALLGH
jgi:drug/metabolite transporter (DMT)-like permease